MGTLLCLCYLFALRHLTIGEYEYNNASSSAVNEASGGLHSPLKISVITSVSCRPGVTGVLCPNGNLAYDGLGKRSLAAVPMAQRAIDEDPTLWPFHNLTVSLSNTQGFAKYSLKKAIEATSDEKTLAIFGLEDGCDQAEMIAGLGNKLVISTACMASSSHPTAVQLGGDYTKVADAAVSFIQQNGWDRVVLMYFFAYKAEMSAVYARLNRLLLENGINKVDECRVRIWSVIRGLLDERYMPLDNANIIFPKLLKETYLKTRVYIVISSTPNGADAYYFLNTMGRMGLLQTGEYSVLTIYESSIGTNYDGSDSIKSSRYFLDIPTSSAPQLLIPSTEEAFHNYRSSALFTASRPSMTPRLQKFISDMTALSLNYSRSSPPCPPLCNLSLYPFHSEFPTSAVIPIAPTLYEAILLYARLVTRLLEENTTDITNGYAVKQYFYNLDIKENESSIPIELDDTAAAAQNITVSTATYSPDGRRGVYGVGWFLAKYTGSGKKPHIEMKANASFNWLNGRPPPPRPRCGFDSELCPLRVPIRTWIIAALSLTAILMITVFSIYYWRRVAFERQLEKAIWKILLQDLVLQEDLGEHTKHSYMSVNSQAGSTATLRMHKSRRMLQDEIAEYDMPDKNRLAEARPVRRRRLFGRGIREGFTNQHEQWEKLGSFATALHKGKLVALKRIYKTPAPLSRDVMKELLSVTSLRHNNINQLVGIVYEAPLVSLVSEYCTKGSLKDMLENDEIRLDRIMRASIVFDLVDGLKYLHLSRHGCHGRLKSSNCLIDSKWILRLAEFGLDQFLEGEERPLSVEEKCRKLLWTSPELLRAGYENIGGTAAGDIYSFGIILHEIFGRQGPFGDTALEPVEIIQRLKFPKPDEPLLRPDMHALSEAPDFIREVMKECWEESYTSRPNITELKEKLESLRAGMSTNLLDNIALMIEKYNNNLEDLVAERVHEIQLEKQKSDTLLAEMLPVKVADALKQGQPVEPECFECVTIYFSDIFGFGDIVREFSALEVVKFLHNVFTMMDGLISDFDAYKVETIGDSYVAVSGLPKRNGDNHAGEIASMSLRFMKAARDRKFCQPDGGIVQLRIGIHSGPCVAGVVGLLMPRYCLFGDTVNTASRMESNGQALKIHCSEECKRILDSLGGYEVVERGYVKMKGKGEKLTYWLISEDGGFRKERVKNANATKPK